MSTKVKYGNEVIASLRAGQSTILNCLGMKMESNIIVEEESDNGSTTVTTGALYVPKNGTYNHTYSAGSFTWGENTEYDFSIPVEEGLTIRVKKVDNLIVPESIDYLNSPIYTLTGTVVGVDGYPPQILPLNELDLFPVKYNDEVYMYMSNNLYYAVIWVKNADIVNETVGFPIFENNTVYVSDFIWVLDPEMMTGVELTLTAPDKRLDAISMVEVNAEPNVYETWIYGNGDFYPSDDCDGFSAVHVNVPSPNLQSKTITKSGTYRPDSGYKGFSSVTVNVPTPNGYVKPSGTFYIYEEGYYNISKYNSVAVYVERPSEYKGSITIL